MHPFRVLRLLSPTPQPQGMALRALRHFLFCFANYLSHLIDCRLCSFLLFQLPSARATCQRRGRNFCRT